MIIVGLTGGIGSGKTTVGRMFVELGVPVYDSDKEAKKLMQSSKKLRKAIKALFGKEAYSAKKLDRHFIAQKVFNDKNLLEQLNAIVHPAVRKHFRSWVKKQQSPYVIQEAAIIFEQGSQDFYDKVILVTAPKDDRIARVLKRDKHLDKNQIENRIENQLPDSEKIGLSDYVIENLEHGNTLVKVLEVHNALLDYS
ncbi:MAG: dephospho-CoA kinase [Aurantibacter sp.]